MIAYESFSYRVYNTFKRPFVRDLAFAIACPTVLMKWIGTGTKIGVQHNQEAKLTQDPKINLHSNAFWQQQFLTYQPRLIELETTSEYQQLTKFLMNRPSPHRLGFHFEGLMLFWLLDGFALSLHPFEVLAHNIQITQDNETLSKASLGKVTLGELDLIIKNHESGEIEHWELAIKFYLGSSPFQSKNWVGINSKDNLQRKIDHMQIKPFSHSQVTDSKGITYQINKRYSVIKGRLFQPSDMSVHSQDWLNPEFPIHNWYFGKQIDSLLANSISIRKAEYVEWFTNREHYRRKISFNIQTVSQVKTGLYIIETEQSKRLGRLEMCVITV